MDNWLDAFDKIEQRTYRHKPRPSDLEYGLIAASLAVGLMGAAVPYRDNSPIIIGGHKRVKPRVATKDRSKAKAARKARKTTRAR